MPSLEEKLFPEESEKPEGTSLENRVFGDPNRDPLGTYDLSFLATPYQSQLTTGNPFSLVAQKAAGMETFEGPLENASKRLVDYNLGVLGKAAWFFDRPYVGVISTVDALTQGQKVTDALSEGWKGLTGGREAGMINLIENAGGDPDSLTNQLGGVGLDVLAGTFLDPVNYITFGIKGPLRGLSAGRRLFGSADNAARFTEKFPRTFKALDAAGITHVPGRVEAAKAGLWGLNVSVPYFGREGITVTPAGLNAMAAQGLDTLGHKLQPLQDFVHKFWGGNRYWIERSGAEELYTLFNDVQQRSMQRTVRHMEDMKRMSEAVPLETRRMFHHAIENPDLVNAEGVTKTTTVRKLTPEEQAAQAAEGMALNIATAKTKEEFNRGTIAEIAGLRNSLDDWTEQGKRLRVVTLSDLETYLFDVADPNYHPGDALERIVEDLNIDPRRVESAISQMLRDNFGMPEDAPAVLFKAVVGEKAYGRMSSQLVTTKEGALRAPTASETMQRMTREAGEFMPERASDLGETGNARILVEVPAYSTLSDEFSNLGGPTGLASMDLKKERVSKVLDALEQNAKAGGDNFDLVDSHMRSIDDTLPEAEQKLARKKYLAEVNRMNKRAGLDIDPNSPTFTQIVEAIHARRIANSHIPGFYTANARRYSEDLLLGEMFSDDPAARYAHQQDVLRKELEVVNDKLKAADEGHIPAAEFVPPDELDDVDLEAMRQQLTYREQLRAHRDKLDEQIRRINEHEAEDAAMHGESYDPEEWKGVREQLNQERWATQSQLWEVDGDPIMEAQARYKDELLAQRDAIVETLKNPDPFERAVYMRDMLKKRTRPRRRIPNVVTDTRMVQGGGIDLTGLSPEMAEHYARAQDMAQDVVGRYKERFRKYDPEFEMPIENYLPHIHAKHETALDKLLKNRRVKNYRNARRTEMQLQQPNLTSKQLDQMLEQEIWERFGVREIRMSKAEREGIIGQFQRRKYSSVENRVESATVLAMQRSNFPIQWEDDFYRTMNSMFANQAKWEMAWDFTEELVRRGFARQISAGMSQSDIAKAFGWKSPVRLEAEHLGGLLAPDKNPFTNLWVDKSIRQLYDRFVTGHVQAAVGNETMQKFLDGMNTLRRVGSAWTLLPFPSYHFRNLVGDTLRATHEGLDINLLDPRVAKRVAVASQVAKMGDPTDIAKALPPPVRAGTGVLPTLADKLGELKRLYPQHSAVLEEDAFWRFLRGNVLEENYRDLDNIQRAARGLGDDYPWKRGLNWTNPNPQDNPLMQWVSKKIGNRIQNQTRAWLFFDRLDYLTQNGILDLPDAMQQAARTVRKSLFDYTDLLPIEQHVWKNINWFYTYMSRSVPYHIERMINEPRTFSKYYRAYMGFWNNYEDEFEPEDTRDFLGEQLGIPTRKYKDEEGHESWAMWSPQGWIGAADVNEAASWVRAVGTLDSNKLLQATAMNTNPIAKAALEQLFAVDMYTGQEIDKNEYSDVFGIPMPYRMNRFLRNVRLVNEFDRLNPRGAWTYIARDVFQSVENERAHRNEAIEGARWLQFATGMRMFEATPRNDVERNLRDLSGRLDDHESTARRALAQGNTLEYNKNFQASMELLPEIQSTMERLRFWQDREREEKRANAVGKANR